MTEYYSKRSEARMIPEEKTREELNELWSNESFFKH